VVIGLDLAGAEELTVRFLTPQNGWTWIGGLPLPVVFQLLGPDGRPLSRTEAAALVASGSCRVAVAVSGVQTAAARCPAYERLTNTFATVWTPKSRPKGSVEIEVSVTYPNSSVVTRKAVSVRIV
jgi:hypothetical protein